MTTFILTLQKEMKPCILQIKEEKVKPYIIVQRFSISFDGQIQKPFTTKRTSSDNQNAYDKCLSEKRVKIEKKKIGILKYRWTLLKNLNMNVKHIALIIFASILYNFCCMNHDICCIGVARMQDHHPNLNENRGISTKITSMHAFLKEG